MAVHLNNDLRDKVADNVTAHRFDSEFKDIGARFIPSYALTGCVALAIPSEDLNRMFILP